MKELVFLYLEKSLKGPFYSKKGYFYDYWGYHLYSNNHENITFITENQIQNWSINSNIVNRVCSFFSLSNKDASDYIVEYLENSLKSEGNLSEKIKSLLV